jgi:hypothetical protein
LNQSEVESLGLTRLQIRTSHDHHSLMGTGVRFKWPHSTWTKSNTLKRMGNNSTEVEPATASIHAKTKHTYASAQAINIRCQVTKLS